MKARGRERAGGKKKYKREKDGICFFFFFLCFFYFFFLSKTHKERFGTDYGFDHELVAICLLRGCYDYGYSITNPFFDPAEIVRKARELNLPVAIHNKRKIWGILSGNRLAC